MRGPLCESGWEPRRPAPKMEGRLTAVRDGQFDLVTPSGVTKEKQPSGDLSLPHREPQDPSEVPRRGYLRSGPPNVRTQCGATSGAAGLGDGIGSASSSSTGAIQAIPDDV